MPEEEKTNRPVGRPPKEEKEIRGSVKKSRRAKTEIVDELYVDPSEIPDGFTVEWKRKSIYGKDDVQHQIGLEKDAWEYASPKDFPSLVGKRYTGNTVEHKDLVLMIRAKEITGEAIAEDRERAVGQVRTKMQEIGMAKAGEAQRVDSAGRSLTKINRSYEKISVE